MKDSCWQQVKFPEDIDCLIIVGLNIDFDVIHTIGAKWKKNRRLLTPAFHFQILDNFFDVFNKNADILCDQLAKAQSSEGVKETDVFPFLKKCTLDIICGKLIYKWQCVTIKEGISTFIQISFCFDFYYRGCNGY